MIYFGIGLSILFWLLDALLDSLVLHETSFFTGLINPGLHHIIYRLLIFVLFILFSSYVQFIINKCKKSKAELSESEVRFRQMAIKCQTKKIIQEKILETAATPILTINSNGEILSVNDEFCLITGYQRSEVLGLHCYELGWDDCCEKCQLIDKANGNRVYKLQCSFMTKDGRHLTVLRNGSTLYNELGQIVGGVTSFVDITEIVQAKAEAEKARKEAEQLATIDYLTGLLNRRAFTNRLEDEVNRSQLNGTNVGMILTDIDHFKEVNDVYGHMAGDIILQEFANCLSKQCRNYDFIGRYGGEEFVICLPNTTCEQAAQMAERMRKVVEDLQVSLPEKPQHIGITASFGVVSLGIGDNENIDSFISRADELMYKAKTLGRNRVCVDN